MNAIASQMVGKEEQQPSGGTTNNNGMEAIGNLLGNLPQENQKDMVFAYLGPIIKGMSPKWGDAIIAILKNIDIPKLLALGKDDKELERTVKEEERKLEEEEEKRGNVRQ